MAARSYLYVPGDQAERLAGAARRGADALVLDLEDAVPATRKDEARRLVGDYLREDAEGRPALWVRVTGDRLDDDAAAVVGPGLSGLFLPKADAVQADRADEVLLRLERDRGLAERSVRLVPLIESAQGLHDAAEVAAHPRVDRLGIGEADLAADLGVLPGPEREEMWVFRAQVVAASARAGAGRPVGPVETALRDDELLERSTARLLRQGFRARTCLTPRQVEVVNRVLTPSADEVARARALVDALDAATASGTGVAVDSDGRIVDEAVVRSAREVLERAGAQRS